MAPDAPTSAGSLAAFDRLVARRISRSGWTRFATTASVAVSLTTLGLMLAVRVGPRGDLDGVAVRALAWASWLVAVPATLGAIGSLAALRVDAKLPRTLRALGVSGVRVELASLRAGIRVVLTRLAVPGIGALALSLVLSRSFAELPGRGLQFLAGTGYVLGLAVASGLAAAGASWLGERRGRWLLVLLLLGPMLASDHWLHVVDIRLALDRVLDGILRLGGN